MFEMPPTRAIWVLTPSSAATAATSLTTGSLHTFSFFEHVSKHSTGHALLLLKSFHGSTVSESRLLSGRNQAVKAWLLLVSAALLSSAANWTPSSIVRNHSASQTHHALVHVFVQALPWAWDTLTPPDPSPIRLLLAWRLNPAAPPEKA